MNVLLRNGLACLLSGGMLMAQSTSTSESTAGAKAKTSRSTARRRATTTAEPSVTSQLAELRDMLASQQRQIQQLQNQLAARDQQIQQAQQAAADANAKASEASTRASQAQTANSDATTEVQSLKESVTTLKASGQSLSDSVKAEQKKVNEAVENPTAIRFKGVTISPTGSFIEAATVWRQRGIGGDINTQFTGIPFSGAPNAHLSEFNGTGRQSRLALTGEGRVGSWVARAYYEADWLSAGVTSNDNQSNSYTMRQRQLYGQIAGDNGWTFTGGQMWSLSTETRTGLDNKTEVLPQTIDPQYHVGFTWARQYGARVTKSFNKKVFLGFSVEQPQTLNLGGGGSTDTLIYQQVGNTGGLYNNQSNYSYGVAPDVIGKIAFEPGYGHYEVFGIARFFRDRVYPNASATSTSAAGAFNDRRNAGGIGANVRFGLIPKKLDLGFHILAGDGVGRYGDSTLADVTVRPDGTLSPIRGGSALGGLELHATPKLDVYAYYGGDYDQRQLYTISAGKFAGYGRPTNVTTGCGVEVAAASAAAGNNILASSTALPTNCSPDIRAVQEGSLGYWYDFYRGPKGRVRQSIQYSYFVKNTWAGTGGSPKAVDNMVWTAFRYYLP